jgi:kinesin family protein 23
MWIEVHSAEEAFAILQQGQQARKTAATDLNSESSRSHSIFTIRLVSAPLNQRGNDVDRGDPSGRHPPRAPHVAEVGGLV